MVGDRSSTSNPFDRQTLAAQLEQTTNFLQDLTRRLKQVVLDLSYCGVYADVPEIEIIQR